MGASTHDDTEAMTIAIDNYQWTSKSELRSLIDDLSIRANRLQGRDPEWDIRFRNAWAKLEETYAVMDFRDIEYPGPRERTIVANAIDELKQVLRFDR